MHSKLAAMHYALFRGFHNFHYSVYDTSIFITMRQILLGRRLYYLLQEKGYNIRMEIYDLRFRQSRIVVRCEW